MYRFLLPVLPLIWGCATPTEPVGIEISGEPQFLRIRIDGPAESFLLFESNITVWELQPSEGPGSCENTLPSEIQIGVVPDGYEAEPLTLAPGFDLENLPDGVYTVDVGTCTAVEEGSTSYSSSRASFILEDGELLLEP